MHESESVPGVLERVAKDRCLKHVEITLPQIAERLPVCSKFMLL